MDVLSKVFDFGDMEYFAGIKMFNQIRDKLGSIWHIKIDMNCSIGYIRRGSEKRSG